jgi:hypothetical protein
MDGNNLQPLEEVKEQPKAELYEIHLEVDHNIQETLKKPVACWFIFSGLEKFLPDQKLSLM